MSHGLSWSDIKNCLFTSESKGITDRKRKKNNNSTQIECGEPLSLLNWDYLWEHGVLPEHAVLLEHEVLSRIMGHFQDLGVLPGA